MGIRFGSNCVFIFYVVFSFSFCLLQMSVICGNYSIEKKNAEPTFFSYKMLDESLNQFKHSSNISLAFFNAG